MAAVVRWAGRFDVPIAARSGGHSYAGYSTTRTGVVVDLSRLRGIRVSNGTATVGPGVQLIDLYSSLSGARPARCPPARAPRWVSRGSRSAAVTGCRAGASG